MMSPQNRSRTISMVSTTLSTYQGPSRATSPTYSETTNASQMNFSASGGPDRIVTRADLGQSTAAFERLVTVSSSYRHALLQLSRATAEFADAMQTCSALKGVSYDSAGRMQAAAGVHFYQSNQLHVLCSSLGQEFEEPLRHQLLEYRSTIAERSAAHERILHDKSRVIRKIEQDNIKAGRKRQRNLQTFKASLAVLQNEVDDLDRQKRKYYEEVLDHEEQNWVVVQDQLCFVVRSSLEIFDHIASKGSDPVLEPWLSSIPDPFQTYGPPQSENEIISVVQPFGLMTASSSTAVSPSPTPSPSTLKVNGEENNCVTDGVRPSTVPFPSSPEHPPDDLEHDVNVRREMIRSLSVVEEDDHSEHATTPRRRGSEVTARASVHDHEDVTSSPHSTIRRPWTPEQRPSILPSAG